MKEKKKKYISLLSVISAISVVYLHANGCFWTFSKYRYWFTANIIECIFFFAVPIFFMITGANLIDYQDKYSTKEYFKKRIKKAFIPFVIWSVLGFIFYVLMKMRGLSGVDFNFIFNSIFTSPAVTIYWFFISLFGIYLCIPLFASVEKKKRNTIFLYVAVTSIIINSLIPFIIDVFHLKISFGIPFFVGQSYIIYVLLGYLLDKNELNKKYRIIIYILGIIGLLLHIVGTYYLSMKAGMIVRTFKGYCNIPSLMYSVSIFVFVKQISKKITKWKFIEFLARYTFPIYLIHIYFLDFINRVFKLNSFSILYRIGMPILIIPLCILIAWLLRKIPVVKNIVP